PTGSKSQRNNRRQRATHPDPRQPAPAPQQNPPAGPPSGHHHAAANPADRDGNTCEFSRLHGVPRRDIVTSPDSTSASSTNRGSTMSNSRAGRTGISSAGFLETLAERSSRHASGSTRLKSRSMNDSRVAIRVTRQG